MWTGQGGSSQFSRNRRRVRQPFRQPSFLQEEIGSSNLAGKYSAEVQALVEDAEALFVGVGTPSQIYHAKVINR